MHLSPGRQDEPPVSVAAAAAAAAAAGTSLDGRTGGDPLSVEYKPLQPAPVCRPFNKFVSSAFRGVYLPPALVRGEADG